MSGGQQIAVSQGTLAAPRTSGQQVDVGQGSLAAVINSRTQAGSGIAAGSGFVSTGPTTNEALTGSAATLATGALPGGALVRLFSRKVGGGSSSRLLSGLPFALSRGDVAAAASRLLSGSPVAASQGAFGKSPARALSGLSMTASTGAVSAPAGASSSSIQISNGGTNWFLSSKNLNVAWVTPGGDFLDAAGVLNGTTNYVSQVVTSGTNSVNISAIDGDLIVKGANMNADIQIDGVAAVGWWVNATDSRSIALPSLYVQAGESNIFIKNPGRGTTLTFTSNNVGSTVKINKVRGNPIASLTALPMTAVAGAAAPNRLTLNPTSDAVVIAACEAYASPLAYDSSYSTYNGMPYMRFAVSTSNQRAISWFVPFSTAEQNEIYTRYALYIEEDVAVGMTELGVKLPGPIGGNSSAQAPSWRLEHGSKDTANPNLYKACDQRYDNTNTGFAYITNFDKLLEAGRWYVFEQRVKANTFSGATPNNDGEGQVWINGNLVYTATNIQWFDAVGKGWDQMHVNVYHGGLGLPTQAIHYRIAAIAASTSRIGPPAELLAAPVPAWRVGQAVNEWREISGTSMSLAVPTVAPSGHPGGRVDAWTSMAVDSAGGRVWSPANGGHSDYAGNEVVLLNLMADAPAWSIIRQPTPAASYTWDQQFYLDGRPSSSHTYYANHYIPQLNKLMRLDDGSTWGSGSGGGTIPHSFNLDTNDWDGAGTYPNTYWPTASGMADPGKSGTAIDRSTGDIYFMGPAADQLSRFNASTLGFDRLAYNGTGSQVFYYRPAVFDHTRGRLMYFSSPYTAAGVGKAWLKSTNTWSNVTFTGAAATAIGAEGSGADYCDGSDRFIVKAMTGATVYAVHPTTFEAVALTTTGGIPPDAITNNRYGIFGSFKYVAALGGFIHIPTHAANAWFLRTH